MKRFFGFALTLAVVAGLAAPAAVAGCGSPLASSTGDGSYYAYLGFNNDDASTVVGKFFQPGNYANVNNGTLPEDAWLGTYLYQGFTINLGDGRINGCPTFTTGFMTVFIDQCGVVDGPDPAQVQALLMSVPQTAVPLAAIDWSFTNLNLPVDASYYLNAGPSPRPRIVSSSRAGDTMNVNYNVPDAAAGVYDATGVGGITATAVYSQRMTDGQMPDLSTTTGWILQSTLAATGGSGSAALDCSDDGGGTARADQWLATGITVNGDVILGCPVAVECGGNLAQPDPAGQRRLRDNPGNDVQKQRRR